MENYMLGVQALSIRYISLTQYNQGEGNGTPFQYSCLENPMDGGAWSATVHGVSKSQTRLSELSFFLLAVLGL